MRIRELMTRASLVRLGLWIGQHMPRWLGYGISRAIALWVAWFKPTEYWTVRANLRQVLGAEVDGVRLHLATRNVFEHAGQTYYDFFREVGQPAPVLAESVRVSPALVELIRSEMESGRGVLLLGIHMSNFDLALLALGTHNLPAQLLSLAGPNEGLEIVDRLRVMPGFEVTPVTTGSLRAAVQRLRNGGLVMTGAEYPVPGDCEWVEFFGRPACLPAGPARLALMTDATVLLGGCYRDTDGEYVLDVSGPIEMVRTGNRKADVVDSMRALVRVIECYIRAHPEQWLMFRPIWPATNGEDGTANG